MNNLQGRYWSALKRRLARIVVLALVGAAIVVAAEPANADPACQNGGFYILGVRGSGAPIGSVEVKKFRDSVRPSLGGISDAWAELGNLSNRYVDGERVDVVNDPAAYPAVGGPNFAQALWAWVVDPGYGNSVRIGTDELVRHLNHRYANGNCAAETLILGGYSQGADVIGWALARTGGGDSWSLNANTRNHIGAVALYGDPKFLGNFGAMFGNCFQPPWAILGEACATYPSQGILGARVPYVPSDIWSRVSSYCADQDGVCRNNLFAAAFGSHTTAYKNWVIADSADRIGAIALSKRNQLNPSLPPAAGAQQPQSGSAPSTPVITPTPPLSRIITLDAAQSAWANDNLGPGGWTKQTDPGTTIAIAAGGNRVAVLNTANEVWAKDGLASVGWTQVTPTGNSRAVAVSSTGRIVTIDACGAAWANDNISPEGWVRITYCADTQAIAAGGNRIVIINGCGAAYGRDGMTGPMHQISGCGNTKAIAVGASGRMMVIDACDSAWASDSFTSGWTQIAPCGNARAVAVGGSRLVLLNVVGEVWANDQLGTSGWAQITPTNNIVVIAAGSRGRIVTIDACGAAWARDDIGATGWNAETYCGNTLRIAVG